MLLDLIVISNLEVVFIRVFGWEGVSSVSTTGMTLQPIRGLNSTSEVGKLIKIWRDHKPESAVPYKDMLASPKLFNRPSSHRSYFVNWINFTFYCHVTGHGLFQNKDYCRHWFLLVTLCKSTWNSSNNLLHWKSVFVRFLWCKERTSNTYLRRQY